MARIKFGNFIVDARGKIAGNIYARNGSGAYAKGYVKPNNPQSSAQTEQRSRLTFLSQAWRTLTPEQQASWNQAAPDWPSTNAVGDPVTYTGEQLFIKVNLNFLSAGETSSIPAKLEAPGKITMPTFTGLEVIRLVGTPTALNMFFETATGWDNATFRLKVFASPLQSLGVTSAKTPKYRLIGVFDPANPLLAFDIQPEYEAVFGSISSGSRIFFKVEVASLETGQTNLVGITKALTTPA